MEIVHPLERHPLSALFGDMESHVWDETLSSIRQEGLSNPNVCLYEGKVLDGWHRYRAAGLSGRLKELRFYEFDDGKESAVEYVWKQNGLRRHWSARERAVAVVSVNEWRKRGNEKKTDGNHPFSSRKGKSNEELASEAGVGTNTVKEAKRIVRAGRASEVLNRKKTAGQVLREIENENKAKKLPQLEEQPLPLDLGDESDSVDDEELWDDADELAWYRRYFGDEREQAIIAADENRDFSYDSLSEEEQDAECLDWYRANCPNAAEAMMSDTGEPDALPVVQSQPRQPDPVQERNEEPADEEREEVAPPPPEPPPPKTMQQVWVNAFFSAVEASRRSEVSVMTAEEIASFRRKFQQIAHPDKVRQRLDEGQEQTWTAFYRLLDEVLTNYEKGRVDYDETHGSSTWAT